MGSNVDKEKLAQLKDAFSFADYKSVPVKLEHLAEVFNLTMPKKPKNVQLVETIKHLKETIEHINGVASNRKDINAVLRVGQRFNGVMGTFAFFGAKDGYQQITWMSEVIDCICKTYEPVEGEPPKEEIIKDHFDMLLKGAKLTFQMLKLMLDEQPLTADQKKSADEIFKAFKARTDVYQRNSKSQSEVDAILAQTGS